MGLLNVTDSLYEDHVTPLIGESHLDDQEWWVGLTVLVLTLFYWDCQDWLVVC